MSEQDTSFDSVDAECAEDMKKDDKPHFCRYCEKEYEPEVFGDHPDTQQIWQFCSDACELGFVTDMKNSGATQAEKRKTQDATAAFNAMTPPEMRETSLERLPHLNTHLKWQPAFSVKKGIMIIGETGRGKTRLAYMLCKRLMIDQGMTVRFYKPGDFASQSQEAYGNGTLKELYARFLAPDIVVLDDLGKERFTPARFQDLFACIDNRLSAGKALIVTSNNSGAEIEEMIRKSTDDPENGPAFIRRLRDSCEVMPI